MRESTEAETISRQNLLAIEIESFFFTRFLLQKEVADPIATQCCWRLSEIEIGRNRKVIFSSIKSSR